VLILKVKFKKKWNLAGNTLFSTNWNATFDKLLWALERSDPTPFLIRSGYSLHPIQDKAFADNLFSVSARREGLQIKTDIVSAFAAIFGIEIATTKLSTFAKSAGEPTPLVERKVIPPRTSQSHTPICQILHLSFGT